MFPILQASQFAPQVAVRENPRSIRVNRAFLLIIGGLFKKVVISNMLATRLVEPVFSVPGSYGRWDTLLAVYGYAAQIYCDFSGYTDIAIGCALLLGYRLPRNFNAPYKASTPQEFWRRWHISLSSWLRDYLYFPLGGSRRGPVRTCVNLMITMLLGGLWHGAGWTFVAWGGLHGLMLVGHRLWSHDRLAGRSPTCASPRPGGGRRTFCFSMRSARDGCFSVPPASASHSTCSTGWAQGSAATLATLPVCIVLFLGLAGQFLPPRWRNLLEIELGRWPALARGAAVAAAIALIEILGPTGVAPFIYFRF